MKEPNQKPKFKRLPGRGATTVTYNTLFLGEDSLIQVASSFGFHESYSRFAYSDIQAITIRKTFVGTAVNIVLALGLAAAFGTGLLYSGSPGSNSAVIATTGILSLVFLVTLLFGLYAGPTCTCHLRTAIQVVRLRSLGRLRNVNKALTLLRPRIEAAQGRLSPPDPSGTPSVESPAVAADPRPSPNLGQPPVSPS